MAITISMCKTIQFKDLPFSSLFLSEDNMLYLKTEPDEEAINAIPEDYRANAILIPNTSAGQFALPTHFYNDDPVMPVDAEINIIYKKINS